MQTASKVSNRYQIFKIKSNLLYLAPIFLIITTFFAFQLFTDFFGFKRGYFFSFIFYWGFWCFMFPWYIIGLTGIWEL